MKSRFPKVFHHKHDSASIMSRLESGAEHSYLKDFVYGSIDGTVTTFAVVSGVVGAGLESQAILILGAANLFADGFSMAASNYMGTKTENQERDLLREFESFQIEKDPSGEENEIRQILIRKGYSGDLLEKNIAFIVSDKNRWIDMMLADEYGVAGVPRSAIKAALVTFSAFVLFGSFPLLTYIFNFPKPFLWASILTGISFAAIGSLKSRWTIESQFVSAIKTLVIGAGASAIAYGVGAMLRGIVG